MKKSLSIVLALILTLTAVVASAETISPNVLAIFAASADNATTTAKGIEIEPISAESKAMANALVESGNLVENLYNKTVFLDAQGKPLNENPLEGKTLTNVVLIPMADITVDDEQVEKDIIEIVTRIRFALAVVLRRSNVVAIFSFITKDENNKDVLNSYKIDFEIRQQEDYSNVIVYKFPVEILKMAEGCPAVMDFEIVE